MAKPIDPFQAAWQHFHPDCVPVGGSLRDGGTWNLTRFHLLPNGRDAAVSRGDFRSLLDRFNIITTEVLGDNTPGWLILPEAYGPDGQPIHTSRAYRSRMHRLKKRYGLTQRWEFYSTPDVCVYKVEAAPITWRQRAFDRLFLDIYHGRVVNAVFMNADNGSVIAPYEVGVYAAKPTPQDLINLVNNYYGWLPVTGDGVLRFDPAQMTKGSFEVSKPCAAAIQRALGT
jgi:hypothetical protein